MLILKMRVYFLISLMQITILTQNLVYQLPLDVMLPTGSTTQTNGELFGQSLVVLTSQT